MREPPKKSRNYRYDLPDHGSLSDRAVTPYAGKIIVQCPEDSHVDVRRRAGPNRT
jgi:hypothetical protein